MSLWLDRGKFLRLIKRCVAKLSISEIVAPPDQSKPNQPPNCTAVNANLQEQRMMTSDPNTHYYSRERRSRLVRLIIAFLIILLLIAPVFVLYAIVREPTERMHF